MMSVCVIECLFICVVFVDVCLGTLLLDDSKRDVSLSRRLSEARLTAAQFRLSPLSEARLVARAQEGMKYSFSRAPLKQSVT